jgi:poly(3-hydroxybutyrate) depolymerase
VVGLEVFLGPADIRARHGAEVTEITIDSRAVGERLDTEVLVPAGAGDDRPRRPLLVFLHGRGGDDRDELNSEMYDAISQQGGRAPIVAFPSGGTPPTGTIGRAGTGGPTSSAK